MLSNDPILRRTQLICVSAVIFLLISVLYYYCIYLPDLLENNHRYTIGRVYKRYITGTGEVADFDYSVNNERYIGCYGIGSNRKTKPQVGKHYYVKFYPPNPDICDVILNKSVPDSLLKKAPAEGWAELPE